MRPRQGLSTGGLVFGVALLVIGLAFLLRNAGVIRLDWGVIWPALVIAVGTAIIVGALRTDRGTGQRTIVVPVDGARWLELELRLGAGRYRLRGGSQALVEAYADEPTIGPAVERRGEVTRVRLSTAVDWWAWGWRGGVGWRIGVATGIPTALDVKAGAGEFDLDLSSVAVASARMSVGAAQLRVVLPWPRGEVPIRVEGGAASFTFVIPPGVEARVTSTGLVSTSGPSETPGYAAARDRVTVTLSGGAASVHVVAGT